MNSALDLAERLDFISQMDNTENGLIYDDRYWEKTGALKVFRFIQLMCSTDLTLPKRIHIMIKSLFRFSSQIRISPD